MMMKRMITPQVAETKNTADITPLFSKGKEIAETKPNTFEYSSKQKRGFSAVAFLFYSAIHTLET